MAKRLKQSQPSLRRSQRSIRTKKKESVNLCKKNKKVSRSTAMDIVNKFSQQFQRVDGDISFRDSPCQSRKIIFSSSMFAEPQNSMNCYDFDEQEDNIRLRLDLSPIKSEKTPPNSKPKKTSATSKSRGKKSPRTESTNKENSSGSITSKNKNSCKRKKVDTVGKNNAKNMKVTPKSGTQKIMEDSSTAKKSPGDSGVFMTPPSLYDNDTSSVPTSTPFVTPAYSKPSINKPNKNPPRKQQESKRKTPTDISYELPESPMLSPVQNIISPNSEGFGALVSSQSEMFNSMNFGSPRLETCSVDNCDEREEPFKALNISKTYASVGFGSGYFDKPIEDAKKRRKPPKKPSRKSVSRYDIIADQMNEEFNDLDDFQLSVD